MITISDKPHKKSEFFLGTITIGVPNCDETEWSFELVRTTNGKVEDEVVVNSEQLDERFNREDYNQDEDGREKCRRDRFMAESIIEQTVLANVKKNTITWNPQNK